MKFWFVHSGEVSLIDQITTQVRMAILAGDLRPDDRLPSVRALARRYGIHHNTVSQSYRRLEELGLVASRRGSGVYVRSTPSQPACATGSVTAMLAEVIAFARAMNLTEDDLEHHFRAALAHRPLNRIVLLDPDPEFRAIALAELRAALPDTTAEALDQAPTELADALVVARPSQSEAIRRTLPAHLCSLRIGSAAETLLANLPGPRGELLGLASRWPTFLEIGRTMLLAAGLDPEALILRDAREPNWQQGLEQAWGIVTDTLTTSHLPPGPRRLIFQLLADDAITELRSHLNVPGAT